jgi:hypothetical protein
VQLNDAAMDTCSTVIVVLHKPVQYFEKSNFRVLLKYFKLDLHFAIYM